MSDQYVDITGLSKAAVLAALFNHSAPQGMGFLQAANGPKTMTVEDAEKLIAAGDNPDYPDSNSFLREQLDYDYLYGRPLKVNLSGDSFYAWGYDRDNGGPGTAQAIIDALRANGETNPSTAVEANHFATVIKAGEAIEMANTPSSTDDVDGMRVYSLGGADVGYELIEAVDREMDRVS